MLCGIIAVLTPMALLFLINHEVYTSNNMQHMLALVDNGIRLAVSENRK